jgi:sugar phosphate permease
LNSLRVNSPRLGSCAVIPYRMLRYLADSDDEASVRTPESKNPTGCRIKSGMTCDTPLPAAGSLIRCWGTGLDTVYVLGRNILVKVHAAASGTSGAARTRVGRYRYVVVAVIWVTFLFWAFDRTGLSLLLADHGFLKEMGLEGSPGRQGLLMTFLLLPYALSNIFFGPAADRWGPRKVLTVMASLWTVAALWMGAISSYPMMLVGRVTRGIAEGPLLPLTNRYVRYWFPPSERGGANAIWTSGQRVGMTFAVPLLSLTLGLWGWRSVFFLQAVLILIVIIPSIWFLTGDAPEKMARVGISEQNYITESRASEKGTSDGGSRHLSSLLRNYRFWLMVVYHFAVLATLSGLTTWLPKYLRDERDFDLRGMVLFVSLPYLGSFLSSLVFGFLSDRLGRRAVLCTMSLSGAAISIGLAALVQGPIVSGLLMVLGMVLWGMGTPVYYAIMQHIIPAPIMATGIGIDNGLANFGSAMAPAAIGFLIAATGSYAAGLLFISALGLIGAIGAAVLAAQKY